MISVVPLLLILACYVPGFAHAMVTFGDYTRVEFAPARDQTFDIPIHLEHPAVVSVALFTADGDLVRTLRSAAPLPPGIHTLVWDGKDEEGLVVPDEAYVPVLTAELANGTAQSVDPRMTSGGESVENLRVDITPTRDIAYDLPAPARVLIRVGIKGGPMLRSLANWEPRGPGKNVQRWDGRDQDGLIDIRGEKDLGILVTAFRLPTHAIITTGNPAIDYRTYRQSKRWPERMVSPTEMVLARGQTRIARQYYLPRDHYAEPKVTLVLPEDLPRSAEGMPRVKPGQLVLVRTDMPTEDRWLMNESLYEVGFFVDHVFLAEEEQGYVPLTWRWKVQGLSPGRHLLTVNISGFGGKVGVASLLFEVAE